MEKIDMIIKREHNDSNEGLIYVDGKINGHKHRFLLDTGAARSTLILDEKTKILNSTSKATSNGVFSTNDYDVVTIHSLNVGFINETDVVIHRTIDNNISCESILGLEIISKYSLLFDFMNGKIGLVNIEEFENERLCNLELGDKKHPYMDISFKSVEAKALWDTGASITIVDEKFIEKNPFLFKGLGVELGTDSGGVSQNTTMYLMQESIIGGERFKPVKVASVDLSHININAAIPVEMILGFPTISQGNWYINFLRKKWTVNLL